MVDHQADQPNDYLDETAATEAYGISKEALRSRRRRKTVEAHQDEEGNWTYQAPAGRPRSTTRPTTQPTGQIDRTITTLESRIESLERQLNAREREVGELHHLLAAQNVLQAPARPWWKVWG